MKAAKIIIIVVLALALIGLAYVKALFSKQEDPKPTDIQTESLPLEYADRFRQSEAYAELVDSLRGYYIDSLERADANRFSQSRFTEANIDSLKGEISCFAEKLAEAENKLENFEIEKQRQFERLVYDFYTKETAGLPADLTDYERSVSIKEIKSKTKKYFSVSSSKLEEIVKKYRK